MRENDLGRYEYLELAVHELTEALRLTVEYIGTGTLPPVEGWTWFDAMQKYSPLSAAEFVHHYNKFVKDKI